MISAAAHFAVNSFPSVVLLNGGGDKAVFALDLWNSFLGS
jgi:hypothetical protein